VTWRRWAASLAASGTSDVALVGSVVGSIGGAVTWRWERRCWALSVGTDIAGFDGHWRASLGEGMMWRHWAALFGVSVGASEIDEHTLA
jgi:hypothetical protein